MPQGHPTQCMAQLDRPLSKVDCIKTSNMQMNFCMQTSNNK